MQEQLVATNRALATSQSDLKAAKIELQQRSDALENALKQCEALQCEIQARGDEEAKTNASEQQRQRADRYQREVRKMRQLLALNARRAADSSKDVETLKQELEHVQQLLRAGNVATHRARASEQSTPVISPADAAATKAREGTRLCRGSDSENEEEEGKELDESNDSWCDLLLTSGKAEESALRCAIMKQVRAFAA